MKRVRLLSASVLLAVTLVPEVMVLANSGANTYSYGGNKGCAITELEGSSFDITASGSDSAADTPTAGGSLFMNKIGGNREVAVRIIELLKDSGLSGDDIAVILAFAARESGMNPKAVNPGGQVAGLWQWGAGGINGSRLTSTGKMTLSDMSTLTVENQVDLLLKELKNPSIANNVINGGRGGMAYTVEPGFKDAKTDEQRIKAFNEGFEGVSMADPQTKAADVIQYAKDVREEFPELASIKGDYSKFSSGTSGLSEATGSISGSVTASQAASQDEECEEELYTGEVNQGILETARKYLGHFKYGLNHSLAAFKDWDNPPKGAITDCSGFIWFILHKAGYDVPEEMGWFTGTMATDAESGNQWLDKVKQDDAKAGDIVIVNLGAGVGDQGHTAFLAEDWKGVDTKMIEMHGPVDETGAVEGRTFAEAFGGLISYGQQNNLPIQLTFARARKGGQSQNVSGKGGAIAGKVGNIDIGKLNAGTNTYPKGQCTWGAKQLAPWSGDYWG